MKNEIEWYENDGCLGGLRGLVFNLQTNIITKWNGSVEKLSENNLYEVQYCIDSNIKDLNDTLSNIKTKLNQNETIYEKIYNGCKIYEPLTDDNRIKLQLKYDELLAELEWYKSICLNM